MFGLRGSVYFRDKEGKLLIPPNALSQNLNEGHNYQVQDYSLENDTKLILRTSNGPVEIKLFDHILTWHAQLRFFNRHYILLYIYEWRNLDHTYRQSKWNLFALVARILQVPKLRKQNRNP